MSKLRVEKIAAPIIKDEFTGSVHFDGTTQNRITIPSTTDFAPGTGDFTIEMWVYHTDLTGQQTYFGDTYGNTSGIYTYKTSNNEISLYDSAQRSLSAQNVIKLNTWHHIAWTRKAGVLRAFVDGDMVDEDTYTGSFTDTDYFIGDTAGTSSGEMIGYISNLRYCKNHAVYTGNFTVPTRELVAHEAPPKGVVLPTTDNITTLLACQSSTDATLDATGRHTLSASDGVTAADANPGLLRRTLNLTTVTENTGSVFFDGTGDYLSIPDSTDFDLGISNEPFTMEFWFYKSSAAGTHSELGVLRGGGAAAWNGSNGHQYRAFQHTDNTLYWQWWNGSANQSIISTETPAINTWHHFAISYDGTTTRAFLNGVIFGSSTEAYAKPSASNRTRIGLDPSNSVSTHGYHSNVRICKGHAVYTSQFTPPTRELEVHEGPENDRTILLCCYDGENIFADKTGRHIIAAYGDRGSIPTPGASDSPVGVTTHNPGLTRNVDPVDGPTFQGGAGYTSQNWLTLPKGTTTDRMPNLSTNAVGPTSSQRGLFLGGSSPTMRNTIDYITIPTIGDAIDFGDLTASHQYLTSVSSNTRGVNGGGDPMTNIIDYVTISTLGNAKDFGDLFTGRYGTGGCSSGIRGVWGGGVTPSKVNTMDYVTISTLGDALNFGDLNETKVYLTGCGSHTRGIFAGGMTPTKVNTIEFITIASTGDANDFGDLTETKNNLAGCSNSIRGVFGGADTPTMLNTIEFVTIATSGNGFDFGDLSNVRNIAAACASHTRGIFAGGADPSNTKLNTIDYVFIPTTGNAVDFGNLTQSRKGAAGCSNSHGGLG